MLWWKCKKPGWAPVPVKVIFLSLAMWLVSVPANAAMLLTWTDNANNEIGFEIQRKTTTIGAWSTLIDTLGVDTESYTDASDVPDTLYCYRVRAYNDSGYSSWSNEACARSAAPPSPNAPSNMRADQA